MNLSCFVSFKELPSFKNLKKPESQIEVKGCSFDQAELDCNKQLKIPICVFPRDTIPTIAGKFEV